MVYSKQSSKFASLNIKYIGYVAVQRKLLCLAYTLWQNDIIYDETYPNNNHKKPATNVNVEQATQNTNTQQVKKVAICLPKWTVSAPNPKTNVEKPNASLPKIVRSKKKQTSSVVSSTKIETNT